MYLCYWGGEHFEWNVHRKKNVPNSDFSLASPYWFLAYVTVFRKLDKSLFITVKSNNIHFFTTKEREVFEWLPEWRCDFLFVCPLVCLCACDCTHVHTHRWCQTNFKKKLREKKKKPHRNTFWCKYSKGLQGSNMCLYSLKKKIL